MVRKLIPSNRLVAVRQGLKREGAFALIFLFGAAYGVGRLLELKKGGRSVRSK